MHVLKVRVYGVGVEWAGVCVRVRVRVLFVLIV